MARTYRVVVRGVPAGRSVAAVARTLAERFEVLADKWSTVLRESRFVLKRGLSVIEAAKYDKALRDAGCRVIVETEDAADRDAGPHRPMATWAGVPSTAAGGTSAAKDGEARSPAWRAARERAIAFFGSRLRRWRKAWTAMPARQKAIAALLAVGGFAIVATAALLSTRGADRGVAIEQPESAPHSRPAAAAPVTIAGSWNCRAEKSSGFAIRDTYVFASDGRFEDRGSGVQFQGVYETRHDAIVMTVQSARMGTTTIVPNLVLEGTVTMLSENEMRLETVARGSGEKKISMCSRAAGQSATG